MTFNSLHFLIFLPIVLALYYVIPHKYRWIALLAASYYAYMSWNPYLAFLILGTTAVSYISGLLMPKVTSECAKKALLSVTIAVCLGALVFFKYFNFLLDSAIGFLNLFSLDLRSPALDIILPVGISFYTFQTLSYVIDVYRGTVEPERHFGYYALFVSYFPQLVAGPIERPQDLIPQLRAKHDFQWDNISAGFRLAAVGFFRKCVAADFFVTFVNRVYSDVGNANALSIAIAALLFMGQIYNDFAGYSEIAMGSAKMMGIDLTRNFDRPLSALSIREYMKRWHITLNTWFRDYVYIPLGGSRKGQVRRIINVLIVYALCGLWHGANWTYVLWGLLVGAVIVLETVLSRPVDSLLKWLRVPADCTGVTLLGHAWVFFICGFAAIIFRASSVSHTGQLLSRFFTTFGFGADYLQQTVTSLSINSLDVFELILIFVFLYRARDISDFAPKPAPFDAPQQSRYLAHISACCYLVLTVLIAWIVSFGTGVSSTFVYFQF